jgi:hypothetical protein
MKTKFVLISIFILLPAAVWLHGRTLSAGAGQEQPKGCGVEAGGRPSTPSQVVCTYYELAARGEIKEAIKHQTNDVDPKQFHSNAPINPGWAELVRDGIIKFSKIETEVVDEDKAEVVASIIEANGKVSRIQHNMYKQEGRWKIFSYFTETNPVCLREPDQCHIIKKRPAPEQRAH